LVRLEEVAAELSDSVALLYTDAVLTQAVSM
jgi:hypothetical protein